MVRITKASSEEFAKEVAALKASEATTLSTEEMDHEAHALAGKELEAKGCHVLIENHSIHVEYPQ